MLPEKRVLGFVDASRKVVGAPEIRVEPFHQRPIGADDVFGDGAGLKAGSAWPPDASLARAKFYSAPLPHRPARALASRRAGGQDLPPVNIPAASGRLQSTLLRRCIP